MQQQLMCYTRAPLVIVDELDNILAVMAGRPNDQEYVKNAERVVRLMRQARVYAKIPADGDPDNCRRGPYAAMHRGCGGQGVSLNCCSA